MTQKDENIEEMLLSSASLDDLIRMKIEAEFNDEMKKAKEQKAKKEKRTYTKISEVPKDYIFSKDAVYKYYNRDTKLETYINGIQAEGYLASDNFNRNKLLSGESSSFVSGENYIKFIKCNL